MFVDRLLEYLMCFSLGLLALVDCWIVCVLLFDLLCLWLLSCLFLVSFVRFVWFGFDGVCLCC